VSVRPFVASAKPRTSSAPSREHPGRTRGTVTLLGLGRPSESSLVERRALSAWAHPACRSAATRSSASRASQGRCDVRCDSSRGLDGPFRASSAAPPPFGGFRRTGFLHLGNPHGLLCSPAHKASAVFWLRGMPIPARARPAFLRLRRAGPRATSNAGRVCFAPATLLSFFLQGFLFRPEIQRRLRPDPPLLLELAGRRPLARPPVPSGPQLRRFAPSEQRSPFAIAIFRQAPGPCPLGFSPL
jgi:hypothetical protein